MIFSMCAETYVMCIFRVLWWPEVEVVELCTKSRADKPESLQEPPTLVSGMERSDKVWAGKGQLGAASKPRMISSYSVTIKLCEILHSLEMDTVLVSWGQHRAGSGIWMSSPRKLQQSLTSWRYAVYRCRLRKGEPKHINALLLQMLCVCTKWWLCNWMFVDQRGQQNVGYAPDGWLC